RILTLGDNAHQAQSLDLFDERGQLCPKLRIEPQRVGKMGADGVECLPSLHQRQIQSVPSISTQNDEDAINNRPPAGAAVLEFLETGSSSFIQRDNLPIENEVSLAQVLQRESNLAEL